ncbi:MAG: sigma-54 dependent transcriptional regulator, partial [Kiritimatiellia bacterium]|nr:sigma-54 dependent transcriptional regulator [Kiritimatiellia bacterium]
ILLDLWMPDQNGIECLRTLRNRGIETPVIMITGEQKPQHAVEAMKAGAFHYLLKPLNVEEMFLVVGQAIRSFRMRRENRGLHEALRGAPRNREWLGNTPGARKTLEMAGRAAGSDATVLITGETGTGKSLMARLLHDQSPRASRPFITVSCATLPRELIESELFGHEKGSYTGAVRERPGRLELAQDGTLFLDEIAELPLVMQPKVLRALQEREFERVGGSVTLQVKARIIAATNQNLEALCQQKEFRQDLFFRLSVLRLHLPPLRERMDDLPILVDTFLSGMTHASGEPIRLRKDALEALRRHPWPGNVRELQNLLERAVTFSDKAELCAADFQLETAEGSATALPDSLAGKPLAEIEALAITQTWTACSGNVTATARALGVTPKTVLRKIRSLGLAPES